MPTADDPNTMIGLDEDDQFLDVEPVYQPPLAQTASLGLKQSTVCWLPSVVDPLSEGALALAGSWDEPQNELSAWSVLLAGGGIKEGQVYGASNAFASEPEEDPLTVEDLMTTVYHQMGIVADKELMAPGDRPIEIVDGGKVLNALLG